MAKPDVAKIKKWFENILWHRGTFSYSDMEEFFDWITSTTDFSNRISPVFVKLEPDSVDDIESVRVLRFDVLGTDPSFVMRFLGALADQLTVFRFFDANETLDEAAFTNGPFVSTVAVMPGIEAAARSALPSDTSATKLNDGRVLAVGLPTLIQGGDRQGAAIFDPATNLWTAIAETNANHHAAAVVTLDANRVLVMGGRAAIGGRGNDQAEIYDIGANTWTLQNRMADARTRHFAVLLSTGKVLVFGGQNETFIPSTTNGLRSCELFDPATLTWSAAAQLPEANSVLTTHHQMVVQADNKVLVVGALTAGQTNQVHQYDPVADTWTNKTNPAQERKAHGLVLLADNKILAAGGLVPLASIFVANQSLKTCEIYDPALNTWASTGSMLRERDQLSLSLLSTGKVIAASTSSSLSAPQSEGGRQRLFLEVFDPTPATWTYAGQAQAPILHLEAAREGFVLAGDKVLLLGGMFTEERISGVPESASSLGRSLVTNIYDPSVTVNTTVVGKGSVIVSRRNTADEAWTEISRAIV